MLVATTAFKPLALHEAKHVGAERIRMLVVPHPFDTLTPEEVIELAKSTFDELVSLLRHGDDESPREESGAG